MSQYVKPQSPLYHKTEDAYFYPLTTADQVIMEDGGRLNVKLDVLSENIENIATTETFKGTLLANNWSSSAPFTQTVNIPGLLSSDYPFVDIDLSEVADAQSVIEGWNNVGRVTVDSDNTVIGYCYKEKPTIDIPMVFKVVR